MSANYTHPETVDAGDGCLRKVVWAVVSTGLLLVFLFGFVVGVVVGVMM